MPPVDAGPPWYQNAVTSLTHGLANVTALGDHVPWFGFLVLTCLGLLVYHAMH